MENLRGFLKSEGFNFKKSLGQNFITDENLLRKIVSLSGAGENDTVIEVGCGAGTLTRALAQKCKRVLSFEVDLSLKPVLEQTLKGLDNVEVIFNDFLKSDLGVFERALGDYIVVANLPYYVTTPVIWRVFEQGKRCKSMTVMVQEEVADRLCASEGTKDYGAITAAIAYKYAAEKVLKVPRTEFVPQPNVDSAVVKLTLREPLEVKSAPKYFEVVKAAFSARRKTFENNLMRSFNLTRWQAEQVCAAAKIPAGVRGETLSPQNFAAVADVLFDLE